MLTGLITIYYIIVVAAYVLNAIAFMRLAAVADRPGLGWMAWIPVCNYILPLLLIKKSGWWVLMFLVPIANIVFAIIWQVKLLNAFGKNGAHVLFCIFLPPVYLIQWIVWGFSRKTTYRLPKMNTGVGA